MSISWLRVAGAVAVGLLSVSVSWYLLETRLGGTKLHWNDQAEPWGSLVKIENPAGLEVRRTATLYPLSELTPGEQLYGNHWISTGPATSVVIAFAHGGPELELGPLGHISVTVVGYTKPRIVWSSGELTVRAPASAAQFNPDLIREGRPIPLDRLTLAAQRWAPHLGVMPDLPTTARNLSEESALVAVAGDETVSMVEPNPAEAEVSSEESLPQAQLESRADSQTSRTREEVDQRLAAQSRQIQSCYVAYRSRRARSAGPKEASRGVVDLQIGIDISGRVTQVEVVKTDFTEGTLKRCLIDVLRRTQFRSLASGDSVVLPHRIRLGL